jgi:hypothetical protein
MPAGLTTIEVIGAALFALAVLHTFSTRYFERLAHANPAHSGLWHLLGEVETVFGFWALILLVFMMLASGWETASAYLDQRRFVEPMFVFAIMVVAASRPVMQFASGSVRYFARLLPARPALATYFLSLSLVPLLGSLITEPAAMTLAALMLRERLFTPETSSRLKYATLGVLFVNISVGGTLTNFAAPPVLMVATTWDWSTAYMLSAFGLKATLAVLVNAFVVTLLFRREILKRGAPATDTGHGRVPVLFVAVNLALLAGIVLTNHHPEAFMGLLLLFLGLADAYRRHHDRLLLREGLMVAFFLAGLVVLGGQQAWWLQDVLSRLDASAVYYGATVLTAVTDNAALTYLGSLVDGVTDEYKYALVAGAVTGGGLTVIANAPNPAGFAILKDGFEQGAIGALGLFAAALAPTLVVMACFRGVTGPIGEVIDVELWLRWFASLDRSFLFLLILPFVIAIVGLWAEGRQRRLARDAEGNGAAERG